MNNLEIYEKVRAVPEEAKKKIGGGKLKGMTDINPMWRIKKLTECFGPCGIGWYTKIINKETYPAGEEIIASVDIELYIKLGGEWSAGIPGTGGSKLVAIEGGSPRANDEAFKMAETDAISVCCKKLGVGADVYWDKDGESKYSQQSDAPCCEKCGTPIQSARMKDKESGEIKFIPASEVVAKSKIKTLEAGLGEHIYCPEHLREAVNGKQG